MLAYLYLTLPIFMGVAKAYKEIQEQVDGSVAVPDLKDKIINVFYLSVKLSKLFIPYIID